MEIKVQHSLWAHLVPEALLLSSFKLLKWPGKGLTIPFLERVLLSRQVENSYCLPSGSDESLSYFFYLFSLSLPIQIESINKSYNLSLEKKYISNLISHDQHTYITI